MHDHVALCGRSPFLSNVLHEAHIAGPCHTFLRRVPYLNNISDGTLDGRSCRALSCGLLLNGISDGTLDGRPCRALQPRGGGAYAMRGSGKHMRAKKADPRRAGTVSITRWVSQSAGWSRSASRVYVYIYIYIYICIYLFVYLLSLTLSVSASTPPEGIAMLHFNRSARSAPVPSWLLTARGKPESLSLSLSLSLPLSLSHRTGNAPGT